MRMGADERAAIARGDGEGGLASPSSRPELSVVIPVYDEAHRLAATVATVEGWLRERRERGSLRAAEVIVVSDGSHDDPASRIEPGERAGIALRFLALPVNRGKGAAVREGVLAARGERVLFTDADLATPIEETVRLEAALAAGAAVAIASRRAPGADVQIAQSPLRRFIGGSFARAVRLLTGLPHADTQCGFKLFRADAARALFEELREERFAFDVEILCRARERGLAVAEVGVVWRDSGESTVRIGREVWRMLGSLVRLGNPRRFPRVFRRQLALVAVAALAVAALLLALR